MRALYAMGTQSQLRLLLEQDDASTLTRNLQYNHYLVTARQKKMQVYLDAIQRIGIIEKDIADTLNELQTLQQSLIEENTQLQTEQAARKILIDSTDNTLHTKEESLKKLHQDRAALQALVSHIDQQHIPDLANLQRQSFIQRKGKMPWPTQGKLLAQFGNPRQGSVTWDGLRIQADSGTAVRAIHSGRVMYADALHGQGLLIILDHGDGYISLYAHNDTLLREAGEWVQPGDVIARVGNSGGEKESALYFEIRKNGHPINPLPWLSNNYVP